MYGIFGFEYEEIKIKINRIVLYSFYLGVL